MNDRGRTGEIGSIQSAFSGTQVLDPVHYYLEPGVLSQIISHGQVGSDTEGGRWPELLAC